MKRYTNEMLKYSRSDAEQYKSQEHFWILCEHFSLLNDMMAPCR